MKFILQLPIGEMFEQEENWDNLNKDSWEVRLSTGELRTKLHLAVDDVANQRDLRRWFG